MQEQGEAAGVHEVALGERQRGTHRAPQALPEREVELLDVRRLARVVTLSMLARAHLAVVRTQALADEAPQKKPAAGPAKDELRPLTVPEVQVPLWRLVWHEVPSAESVLDWSRWRRQHQARARRCHSAKCSQAP